MEQTLEEIEAALPLAESLPNPSNLITQSALLRLA
jgi:hypothetical protein